MDRIVDTERRGLHRFPSLRGTPPSMAMTCLRRSTTSTSSTTPKRSSDATSNRAPRRGRPVHAWSRGTSVDEKRSVDDVCSNTPDVDTMIHLAARAGVRPVHRTASCSTTDVNLRGTIVSSSKPAVKRGIKKFHLRQQLQRVRKQPKRYPSPKTDPVDHPISPVCRDQEGRRAPLPQRTTTSVRHGRLVACGSSPSTARGNAPTWRFTSLRPTHRGRRDHPRLR